MKTPPDVPLPDPSPAREWYGETWLKYPLDQKLYPSYLGDLIMHKTKLRIIMNDIAVRCFSKPGPSSSLSRHEAMTFHLRLRNWYNSLPEQFRPRNVVLPSHIQLL